MKKLIFCTLLLIAGISKNNAQVLQFGVKAGANFSNFTGGDIEGIDFKSVTSYHLGLVMELNLLSNLSIQPELLYSTQGSELKGLGEQIKNELGYISIPVLAKFYLTQKKLSIEAGPQISFLVSERDKVDGNDTNTFDFGLAGGLSLKLTENIFVSGRYIAGLTEVKKDADVKNSVIQLSVGLMF